MKQFFLILFGYFQNFSGLSICQVSLFFYLNHWLQPYFT